MWFRRRAHGAARTSPMAPHGSAGRHCSGDGSHRRKDTSLRKFSSAMPSRPSISWDGRGWLKKAERGVLVQGSMGPRFIIGGSIGAYDPAQVRFTEHDDVVQALPADRANESLNASILPG